MTFKINNFHEVRESQGAEGRSDFAPLNGVFVVLRRGFSKISNRIVIVIVYGFSLFLIGCSQQNHPPDLIAAQVTQVISGQTVEVMLTETGESAKVRIIGIEAPDLRQLPWGAAAKTKLTQLLMGLPVQLEIENSDLELNSELNHVPSRDRFERINAHIWYKNTLVSQQLVQEGCVLANTEYPHLYSKLLINAQEYARLLGYGIWNPDRPLRYTPKQFRSNQSSINNDST